jgi:hypothetical protein
METPKTQKPHAPLTRVLVAPEHRDKPVKRYKVMPQKTRVKYDPKYCRALVEYFDYPPTRTILVKKVTTRTGVVTEIKQTVPSKLKHMIDWCKEYGVSPGTLDSWKKGHSEFAEAFEVAKQMREKHLAVNALNGSYNASFAALAAKNWFGWKERTEVETVNEAPTVALPAVTIQNFSVFLKAKTKLIDGNMTLVPSESDNPYVAQ